MIKNVLASVAAAGLLIAPIAAQAGTRAVDSGVSMKGAERGSASFASGEYAGQGIPMWLLILLFAGAGAGIIGAVESGSNDRSPGT